MRTKRKMRHITFRFSDGAFQCDHCGGTYLPALPMKARTYLKKQEAFTYLHADCRQPERGHLAVLAEAVKQKLAEGKDIVESINPS